MKKYLKYLIVSVLTFVFGIVNVNAETITLPGLIDGLTADSNGIYTLADGTKMAYDGTDENNLRYLGRNPNNWVLFNGETSQWRIIGLMNKIDDGAGNKESRLKLVRASSIGNNKYSWDSSDVSVNYGVGINDWSQADLMTMLNSGPYYNRTSGECYNGAENETTSCDFSNTGLTDDAKNLIGNAVWNLGAIQYNAPTLSYLPNALYSAERSNIVPGAGIPVTWTGKVALMYISDYGYATAGGTTYSRTACLNTAVNSSSYGDVWYYGDDCAYNDWLYENDEAWVLTPRENNSNNIWCVNSSGGISTTSAAYTRRVKPAVYLKSTVQITGGSGTESDPYTLTNVVKYNVTTSSDNNGSITASAEVNKGDNFEVEFTPNTGYEIDKVLVNNIDVTNYVTNSKLTINNITADTTVSVTYKMIRFDVTTTSGSNGTITGGATVNYNADYTITLTPDTGYEIDTVSVNGVDVTSGVTDNKLVLKNILEDKTVKVTYKTSSYKFIEGMNQEFKDDDMVFKTDGPLSIVDKVYVNDEELDSSKYTLKSGSTIITILKDYLTTLSDATYNLKITYTNGSEATTTFVVKASTPASANTNNQATTNNTVSTNPQTSDTIMISVIIGIISLIGLASVIVISRKKKLN